MRLINPGHRQLRNQKRNFICQLHPGRWKQPTQTLVGLRDRWEGSYDQKRFILFDCRPESASCGWFISHTCLLRVQVRMGCGVITLKHLPRVCIECGASKRVSRQNVKLQCGATYHTYHRNDMCSCGWPPIRKINIGVKPAVTQ